MKYIKSLRTHQGRGNYYKHRWGLTNDDRCPCGDVHHTVENYPLYQLNGGLDTLNDCTQKAVTRLNNGTLHSLYMFVLPLEINK